ncbi:flippase [Halosimplex halophilum]|uniref:flippase n=1 Tax=Halosimplex halophilum TaxID=2559572 RepID=UPI00107F2196|nr:flippase [Halosimplex halophilum]
MSSISDSLGVLARGAVVVFVGTVAGRALGVLGQVLIVRALSVELFGQLALALTVVSAVGHVSLLGVPKGTTRLISGETEPSRRREVLHSSVVLVAVGAALATVLVYAFRHRIAALMDDPTLARNLLWFLPYLLVFPLAQVLFAVLQALKESARTTVARDLFPRVCGLALFGVLAALGYPYAGAIGYWLAIPALGALAGYAALAALGDRRPSLSVAVDGATLGRLWTFSWPLAVGSSIVMFLSDMDLLMIGLLLDTAAVGQYRAVQPLREITLFVLTSFTFLYYPIATEFYEEGAYADLDALYATATKWITTATLPLALTFVLFAPDVVRVFFTARYLPAAPALAVLIAGMFLRVVVGPNGAMLKAIDRTRVELVASALGLVVNVALNLLLIPRYRLVGAALATGAGFAVFNLVEVVAIYLETGSHPFSFDTVKPLVVTVAAGAGIARALAGRELSFVALLGVGAALTVVQVVALVVTRSLDERDRELVERWESRFGVDLAPVKRAIRWRR